MICPGFQRKVAEAGIPALCRQIGMIFPDFSVLLPFTAFRRRDQKAHMGLVFFIDTNGDLRT